MENSDNSIAAIFIRSPDIASFQKQIELLDAGFILDLDAMISLGEAYFHRFPDSHHNRKMEEVHYGYIITRICIIEKILEEFSPDKKLLYRMLFHSTHDAQETLIHLQKIYKTDEIVSDYKKIFSQMENTKRIIDEIPKGMIKERYIGGISYLFNILYFLKMSLDIH